MSFIDRIHECNHCDPAGFRPWRIAGQRVGLIRDDLATQLRQWPQVFNVTDTAVTLAPPWDASTTPEAVRTEAVAEVIAALRATGQLGAYWWGERYVVNHCFTDPPLLQVERAAVQQFGISGYGVHINGYVRQGNHLFLWIARRSPSKPNAAGKLDQMVAGGQPAGIGLLDNVVKECAEEAAVPEALARRARPAGAVTYCLQTRAGLRPDVIYCFDLELPPDFTPVNTDNEVEAFYLWPVEQVLEIVRDTRDFKFNCALVLIDFFIRHGYIDPTEPDYLSLLSGLRQRDAQLARFPE